MNRARRAAVVVAVLVVSAVVALPPASAADSLIVHTTAGDVRGVSDGGVDEWRGVPYAASPLGDRRWRPPQPVPAWTGVRAADEFAPQCIQLGRDAPVEGSEDCLNLNVFAPAGAGSGSALPVMVHLHGGSNWFFHSYRHAQGLVRHGVIVVTVEYRLGVFGFVGHPELSAEADGSSGEYGVLDQLAALRWVRDNIAAFGGDPANMTLFGESAGSFDAVAIAASPLGRGLFTRLAAQTESFWAARGLDRIGDAEELGADVANAVGCSGADDVTACLRAQPADALVLAAGAEDVAPYVGGVVLPASPLELIAAQPKPPPMLLGSNREEAALFLAPDVLPGDPYSPNAWVRDTNDVVGPQHGAEARRLYPVDGYDSAFWSTVGLMTDAVYTCPMRRLALASRGPVYRYLYAHTYDNHPLLASFRSTHFLDDPLLWHDSTLAADFVGAPSYEFSADEEVLSSRMSGYWTNFAKTGDPNGPGLPPWPQYTEPAEITVILDEPAGEVSGYQVAQCDFLDPLPNVFALAPEYTPNWERIGPRYPR